MRHFDDIEGEERREYTYNVDSVSQRVVIVQNPLARHEKDDGSHVIMAQTIMGGYVEKEIEAGWDYLKIVVDNNSIVMKDLFGGSNAPEIPSYEEMEKPSYGNPRNYGMERASTEFRQQGDKDARDVMAEQERGGKSMNCLEHDPNSVPPEEVCGFYPSCGCNTSVGDGGEGNPPNPPATPPMD